MAIVEQEHKRAKDTRERILEEAEKLYHAGGYDKISLQEVADALGIKKPALFYHYKNKQELFYAMLKAMLERMNGILTDGEINNNSTTKAQLLAILQRMTLEPYFNLMRFLREDYGILSEEQRQEIQQIWNDSIFTPIHQIFRAGISKGELKSHNPDTATFMFLNLWMMLPRVSGLPVNYQQRRINATEHIEEMLNLFMGGLQ